MTRQRRRPGTHQVQRTRPPLVGPGQRVPSAAPDQSRPGLDRPRPGSPGKSVPGRRMRRRDLPAESMAPQGRQRARHRPRHQAAEGGVLLHAWRPARAASSDYRRSSRRGAGAGRRRAVRRRHLHVEMLSSTCPTRRRRARLPRWPSRADGRRSTGRFLFAVVGAEYVLRPSARRVRPLHPGREPGDS